MLAVAPHVLFGVLIVAAVVVALFMAILACCDGASRADDWMEEQRR